MVQRQSESLGYNGSTPVKHSSTAAADSRSRRISTSQHPKTS
ncbi:hypothetical protein HanPSC8_Chr02g0055251 [Helianthus annuus]|nr:hypothetical protein HanPSC8_Chr02g0055251 [Helianthus annuus]